MSLDVFSSTRNNLTENSPEFDNQALAQPALGPVALGIGMPHLGLVFQGLPESLASSVSQEFAAFIRPESECPDHWRRILVHQTTQPHFLVPRQSEFYRIEEKRLEDLVTSWSYGYQACWPQTGSEQGHLWLCEDDFVGTLRALSNFFRVVLASHILSLNGVLLHSSGLVRNEKAYLFFGHSGSGKSTVVELSPEDRVLSDDLVAVWLENGKLWASGTPMKDKATNRDQSGQAFEVAGFFRLIQAPLDRLETLGPAKGLAELTASVPFMNHRSHQSEQVADILAKMTSHAATYRLHFTRSKRFWKVLDRAGL